MYEDKTETYYSFCRTDLLKYVPLNRSNRILEIGAGRGDTLLKAKESGLAAYVVGIELTKIEKCNQSHPALDRFLLGNIETMEMDFEENSFDVIMCGDVLEHLLDPWQCLTKLRPFLRDGGVIIASIPNVRYWKVSLGLLVGGRWSYSDAGVLDRTHLRFFVKETSRLLFADTGFKIVTMNSNGPQREWGIFAWALNLLTFGLFADLLTYQFVIVAAKKLGIEMNPQDQYLRQ
jgi:2-polyprenyl-3-methyl-5-hydroxy-6-metoxy-1,4-benzoquinol methylase